MMMKEAAWKYYIDQDMNCAESISRAANEVFGLGLDEAALHAVAGFGAGCYAGRLCGACAGGVAAMSVSHIRTRARTEPESCQKVGEFTRAFIEVNGSDLCCDLKEKNWDGDRRCWKVVERAAEILEKKMRN